jgi:hypothetical protein
MRIITVILAGSVAALFALATPALARHSETQKTAEEMTATSPCHAYQMAPDGSWKQLPCQEEGAAAQPTRKATTRSTADSTAR